MKWNKGTKETLMNIENVNTGKYVVNLCQRDYIEPEGEEEVMEGHTPVVCDVEYVPVIIFEKPTEAVLKQTLKTLQREYDGGSEVNTFTVNNISGWFNKSERISIKNSAEVFKAQKKTAFTLWIGNQSIVDTPANIISLINSIDIYANECYNVTMNKLNEIDALEGDTVFSYDVTDGYPEPLNL